jgi:hypothetical protein
LGPKPSLPKTTITVIFRIRPPGQMLVQALHQPAQVAQALAPLVDDELGKLSREKAKDTGCPKPRACPYLGCVVAI